MADKNLPDPAIALVTGGNKGIGREIVTQLAARGMTVVLGSRDRRRGEDTAEQFRSAGLDVHPVELDVTDATTVKAAAAHVDGRFGRLDVLVNNAGIAASYGQSPSSADLDVVRAVFETNYFGVLIVTNAMMALLRRSPAGRVVNMSSIVGSLATVSDPDGPLAGPGLSATSSTGHPLRRRRSWSSWPRWKLAAPAADTSTRPDSCRGRRRAGQRFRGGAGASASCRP